MKKMAVYIRVSTMEQAEHGYSVSEQTERLTKFCEVKDWAVYDTYIDNGYSAATLERPALQRMMKDIKSYDGVLVYKLDRLSRSQKDTLYLIEDVFNEKGIDFISLNENLDTSTPFGKAMIGILSVFSQLEREQIAERMAMGRRGRARSGKASSWTELTRPYGYEVVGDVYEIVPHEAKVVTDIFNRFLSGESTNSITNDFTLSKIDNKVWYHATVTRILSNPIYYGGIRHKNEVFEGLHEPLITLETFIRAEDELDRRRIKSDKIFKGSRPFQSKHPLSGLLTCGICGATMTVTYSSTTKKGQKPNIRYKCRSRVRKYRINNGITEHCGNKTYANEDIETIIYEELAQLKIEAKLPDDIDQYRPDLESYQEEIDTLDKQKERLIDLYVDNLIDKDNFEGRKRSIEDRQRYFLSEIEAFKDDIAVAHDKQALIKDIQSLPDDIQGLPKSKRREIVNRLVENVILTQEQIDVYWSFDN